MAIKGKNGPAGRSDGKTTVAIRARFEERIGSDIRQIPFNSVGRSGQDAGIGQGKPEAISVDARVNLRTKRSWISPYPLIKFITIGLVVDTRQRKNDHYR